MFNIRKTLIVVITLLFSQGVFAQEKLTLQEAVNFALKHKSDALKAKLDVENSEYKIEEVRGSALPQISMNGALTHNVKLQQMALNIGGQTSVIKMGQPWQSSGTIQVDQQIFNMAVFTGLKAAKSTRDFYIVNATLTEEQIIEKVANSYYEVFKTKSQIVTLDKTIQNTTRVRDILKSLYDNGLAKKIDLDRMNVALNNLMSNKQQLKNANTLQENSLKYLIGMNISDPIEMPESTFEIEKFDYLEKPTNIFNRTEVKLLQIQGELLQLNKTAINAQRYPNLAFAGNYGYMGLGDKFPYFAGKNNGVNWSDFSAVSLNLRVPLFTGFTNRAKVRQAQVEIDRFNIDLEDTKLALSLAVENAHTQITNSVITLNAQKANMKLAKDVLDNVENNYKNGLATLTDLLDSESSYADAQNNYTNALLDYKLAEIQIIKAKGELKPFYSEKSN